MKTTPQMTSKWAKGAFLAFLGIILLFYSGNFIKELETNASESWNLSFDWTWDLLQWILWILIAWLFVDAALTIALSFRMDNHTLSDVMARLDKIEESIERHRSTAVDDHVEDDEMEPMPSYEEEPPPPA